MNSIAVGISARSSKSTRTETETRHWAYESLIETQKGQVNPNFLSRNPPDGIQKRPLSVKIETKNTAGRGESVILSKSTEIKTKILNGKGKNGNIKVKNGNCDGIDQIPSFVEHEIAGLKKDVLRKFSLPHFHFRPSL